VGSLIVASTSRNSLLPKSRHNGIHFLYNIGTSIVFESSTWHLNSVYHFVSIDIDFFTSFLKFFKCCISFIHSAYQFILPLLQFLKTMITSSFITFALRSSSVCMDKGVLLSLFCDLRPPKRALEPGPILKTGFSQNSVPPKIWVSSCHATLEGL
jgi:hypothetical protein